MALVLVALGAALGGGSSPTTGTTGTTGTSVAAVAPVAEGVAPIAGGGAAAAAAPAPSPSAVRKAVPNVVGMGHQAAQDALQAAGFYNLAEEDATGQGRLLVWDRNWRVVAQVPASGTVISTDDRVLLRSKKITDP